MVSNASPQKLLKKICNNIIYYLENGWDVECESRSVLVLSELGRTNNRESDIVNNIDIQK